MKSLSLLSGIALAALALPLSPALAQTTAPPPPDDQQDQSYDGDALIVTGSMRVRQGGAQDIKHFRASATADSGLPLPESLTAEGLMGEHDLTLPASAKCAQLFCIVTEAMPAMLPTRPDDRMFVGLGFTSNIDAATWKRAPLNLVAVVDKSGSMNGKPLELVRSSLLQILGQMGEGDRLSIVLYGDRSHVYLQPTDVAGHREAIAEMIRGIVSSGSTNMEAGLRVGYDTAFADAPGFHGTTRMMLFTDEQPNVGATDAASFIGMAQEASRRGIGLTTIGVGVQFGASLATKVSSTRGGNLFFIANRDDVEKTFAKQLDTMTSELAHDLVLTLKPATGYKISGVFGVPDGTMEDSGEGAISVRVPSVFLSTNGGGIFATLAKSADRADLPAAALGAGAPVVEVSVSWNDARDGKPGTDRLVALAPAGKRTDPSMQLSKAHLLVDEYLSLRGASVAYNRKGDPKAAFALLDGLARRIDAAALPGMDDEKKLVGTMRGQAALYAGYAGEAPKSLRHLAVVGRWKVTGATGFEDIHRGDQLEFTSDAEMNTYRKAAGFEEADETESYEINDKQIHLVGSRLVMNYRPNGDKMIMSLSDNDGRAYIWLSRMD